MKPRCGGLHLLGFVGGVPVQKALVHQGRQIQMQITGQPGFRLYIAGLGAGVYRAAARVVGQRTASATQQRRGRRCGREALQRRCRHGAHALPLVWRAGNTLMSMLSTAHSAAELLLARSRCASSNSEMRS